MKMVKAIIRPERSADILSSLSQAGFRAATRTSVLGRGKQQGLRVGNVHYGEISKDVIIVVVENEDCDKVIEVITSAGRTGNGGAYGDGKIFIQDVERVVTISSGAEEL
ncbi:MAG: P-II family nitrogen regulator [Clostridiales bacterium]|jgi:nitrogen regulatory protein PII 1|nr:P-II family nitrogen regulator [Clostridiales bacterium]